MVRLELESFFNVKDYELSQYQFLYTIKYYYSQFRKNKLYPGLSELSEINIILKDFERKELPGNYCDRQVFKTEFNSHLSKIKGLDSGIPKSEISYDFIEWAKPLIKEAVNEGRVIYDFVKKSFSIEEINSGISRFDEGFFLIPDNIKSTFELFEFYVSYTSDGIQKRFLTAHHLDTIPKSNLENSTVNTILALFKKYKNMHKSAVYVCNTDLDFPFNETVLPVAKRKLIARIA